MDFFDALIRYETNLWNHVDNRLKAAGAPSLAVLSSLRVIRRYAPSARVHELRQELRITVGAASKLADRLEKEGLAQRQPHPSDRRSSLIALSPAGERALDLGAQVLQDALDEHLAGEDVSALASAVQRLDESLTVSAAVAQ
ncbi:MarR family winged helix-turn-helix transcriptional regulator [Pseudarthrobacter sulfonivorans]|uniref:MarR family winged helix-turn-helix transcriptional regulator n=1 Tax=Pseudarthrobacter sulfonivorans TaxID=121292 RepID=UPI00278A1C2F|nr:MarR family transcriptional regulator [Pseudarthrobacter sulfonivorans]MDQ0000618.1 DNA-binding MarR family transcriptional regulator [Pseudarthrobacter sulfonivorans]